MKKAQSIYIVQFLTIREGTFDIVSPTSQNMRDMPLHPPQIDAQKRWKNLLFSPP